MSSGGEGRYLLARKPMLPLIWWADAGWKLTDVPRLVIIQPRDFHVLVVLRRNDGDVVAFGKACRDGVRFHFVVRKRSVF